MIGAVRSWNPTTVDAPWPDSSTGDAWSADATNVGLPSGKLGPGTRSCTCSDALGDSDALAITTVRCAASGLGDNGNDCVGKLSCGVAGVCPPSPLLATAPPISPAPHDANASGMASHNSRSPRVRNGASTRPV